MDEILKKLLLSPPHKNIINEDKNELEHINCGRNIFIFNKENNNKLELESFIFKNNSSQKLYVFFTAIGILTKRYPIFHRVSYAPYLDGISIFFDDPTRKEINFSPSFYFGYNDFNCLDYIYNIIETIINKYKINKKNVFFISSSNGGFAAIYLCNKLKGSNCISLCPQLDIKLYLQKNYQKFLDKVGLKKIDEERNLSRLNLYNIINNIESKFFIYSNIFSLSDNEQIKSFFKFVNKELNTGLQKINENIYLLLVKIDSINPHIAQPNLNFVKKIIYSLEKESFDEFDFGVITEYMNLFYKENKEKTIYENICKQILNKIEVRFNSLKNYIDFYYNIDYNFFIRILNYSPAKLEYFFSFRITNYILYTNKNNLVNFANIHNYSIDIDEKNANIFSMKKKIKIANITQELLDFIYQLNTKNVLTKLIPIV